MFDALMTWVDGCHTDPGLVQRARVRAQHLVAATGWILGVPYALLFWSAGVNWSLYTLFPLAIIAPLIVLFTTRRGSPELGGRGVSFLALFYITGALIARGGIYSNSAAWMLIVPVFSMFLVGPKHGVRMSLATTAVFVVLWSLQAAGVAMPPGLPPELLFWMPLLDFPFIALILGGLLYVQSGVWERAERQALDAAQARYTFLATMSHEIRTPLNGVLGLTEVLLDSELNPDQRQLVDTVHNSGELLRGLLDDVLDYSKIDSGHLELESIPVDLWALTEGLVSLWQPTASEHGLVLQSTFEPGSPRWIQGDPTKLQQILGNLISNALKFTDKGQVSLLVSVSGERLQLSVQDSGIGISQGSMERVFEAFRQADGTTTRRFGGTGLGLAICRRLAQFMEGDILVASTLGQGSTFTLQLPLVLAVPPVATSQALEMPQDLSGLRVLVAEDNPVNQLVISRLLEQQGVHVILSSDGNECVEKWESEHPDLILMDCQMPHCDGYQATERIRGQGGTLPIIALTASSMVGDRVRCLDAGMNEHLGKPIDPQALTRALRTHRPLKRRTA